MFSNGDMNLFSFSLAMSGENRENTLFYSEIPKTINKAAVLMLSWKPLLDLFQVSAYFLTALWRLVAHSLCMCSLQSRAINRLSSGSMKILNILSAFLV